MSYALIRSLLFRMQPERAHHFTLDMLRRFITPDRALRMRAKLPSCPRIVFGVEFPNPVGLAAGMDQHAEYLDALFGLGFGFIEVGGVTPKPQPGNPRPRLYRVPQMDALVNRMGFPNRGVDFLVENLKRRKVPGIVGVNITKNVDTPLEKAIDDYHYCLKQVYNHVDYVTVNISSPNTPGLRRLQTEEFLAALVKDVKALRQQLHAEHGKYLPLVIKVAPDLERAEIEFMAEIFLQDKVDGIVATNTALDHSLIEHLPHGNEKGGMSGRPLFIKSTDVLKSFAALTQGKIPIIGLGGIDSVASARAKFDAGASLLQLYTGLIYQGPKLVHELVRDACA